VGKPSEELVQWPLMMIVGDLCTGRRSVSDLVLWMTVGTGEWSNKARWCLTVAAEVHAAVHLWVPDHRAGALH